MPPPGAADPLNGDSALGPGNGVPRGRLAGLHWATARL